MTRRIAIPVVVGAAMLAACSSNPTGAPTPTPSLCERAAAHVVECLGELPPEAASGTCDELRAQEILEFDCTQVTKAAQSGKAEGWWDNFLCSLGFKAHCPLPHEDAGPQPAKDAGPQPAKDAGPQPTKDTGPQPAKDAGRPDSPAPDSGGTPFSFAVIADPHIDDLTDANHHLAGLNAAIADILSSRSMRNTKLVFVLGDIAWGGGAGDGDANLAAAKSALDVLFNQGIPYVPLIGDDDVWGQCGPGGTVSCELKFKDVFDPHYTRLAAALTNWKKAPMPVKGKYLQSFSFDYGEAHFIGADLVSRSSARSEAGDLHDETDGSKPGTWPWLKQDLQDHLGAGARQQKSVIFLSHIPLTSRVQVQYALLGQPFQASFELGAGIDLIFVKMAPLGFTDAQANLIATALKPHQQYLAASYAGHLHFNAAPAGTLYSSPLDTYLTHPTWSPTQCDSKKTGVVDNWTVRYVKVQQNGGLSYQQEVVEPVPGKNASGVCIYKD